MKTRSAKPRTQKSSETLSAGLIVDTFRGVLIAVKVLLLVTIASILLILGLHGLYANFQTLDTTAAYLSGKTDWLFFSIEVPSPLSDSLQWMTNRGIQSPFVPGTMTLLGLGVVFIAIKT